jgi:hypothetical protein
VRVERREVVATVLGLIAFVLFLPPLVMVAFCATGGWGGLSPFGWEVLVVPTVLGVALVATGRRLVHYS